jgi:hypothetical protein
METINFLTQISALLILCFAPYSILQFFSFFKKLSLLEKIVVSAVLGIFFVLFPLYIAGTLIGNFFVETSLVIYVLGLALLCVNVFILLRLFVGSIKGKSFRNYINALFKQHSRLSFIDFALVVCLIFFAMKYVLLLETKAILDYDVSTTYLPLARTIVQQNHIPLTMNNIYVTGTVGNSVLFSWIYVISFSLQAENFRLLPFFFTMVTIIIVYLITKQFFNSNVSKLAVLVFMFLPMVDSSLVWFSFYADISFVMLMVSALYFLLKYLRTKQNFFLLFLGLSIGLSSFMKSQFVWLFPVLLFCFIPTIKNRALRYFMCLIIPFVFLLGITPLSYGVSAFQRIFIQLASYFSVQNFWYGFSIILLSVLIAFLSGYSVNNAVFDKFSKLNVLKVLAVTIAITTPFFAVWYIRNYLQLGTFLWHTSINNADLQWASTILQTSSSSSSGPFYLSLLLFPIVLPALGTAFLLPKLASLKLLKIKPESFVLFAWAIGYFLISFGFTSLISDRVFYPLLPFIAIFSAAGIYFVVRAFKKFEDINTMILLGCISTVQSNLIYQLSHMSSTTFISDMFSQISSFLGLSWSTLSGQLSMSTVINQTMSLIFVALVSTVVIVCLLFFVTSRNMSKKARTILYFGFVFVTAFAVLFAPYYNLVDTASNGDISSFGSVERTYYGYGNLYPNIVPYLVANGGNNFNVLTYGVSGTGLAYYLKNATLFDVSQAETVALFRGAIQSEDATK